MESIARGIDGQRTSLEELAGLRDEEAIKKVCSDSVCCKLEKSEYFPFINSLTLYKLLTHICVMRALFSIRIYIEV